MARGAWLPEVRFDPVLRKELARYLRGHDAPVIIQALEQAVQTVPVFRRVRRPQSVGATLKALQVATAEVRQRLAALADDEEAEDLVRDALMIGREQAPGNFRKGLIERLDILNDALEAAETMIQGRAAGGRPRDLEATWLVEQVTDTLNRHGVPVTDEENGVRARILQALWPHALAGREAPIELKPWFKLLKSQR